MLVFFVSEKTLFAGQDGMRLTLPNVFPLLNAGNTDLACATPNANTDPKITMLLLVYLTTSAFEYICEFPK